MCKVGTSRKADNCVLERDIIVVLSDRCTNARMPADAFSCDEAMSQTVAQGELFCDQIEIRKAKSKSPAQLTCQLLPVTL